jgi:hypothetical protein
MRRGNDWERRFGRRRRARDRELLAELERQIGLEDAIAGLVAADREELERRARLARAFGRQVD